MQGAPRGLPQVYRGRARRTTTHIYDSDHAEGRRGGRFRWMVSTCLAAMVGAIAIGVVVLGSLDVREAGADFSLRSLEHGPSSGRLMSADLRSQDGLRWAVPRSDRMQPAAGAPTVRQLIHEQIQVRRNGRPYNQIRPYVRIVTRLQVVPSANADVIPGFNPIALYGVTGADRDGGGQAGPRSDFKFEVKELIAGSLPIDDGLELDAQEAREIAAQFEAEEAFTAQQRQALASEQTLGGPPAASAGRTGSEPVAPSTTTLRRKPAAAGEDAPDDLERQTQRIHTIQRGDTLTRVLRAFGGELVQVRAMLDAMKQVMPEAQVLPGLQLHVTLVPSLNRAGDEPARFALFTEAGEHKVSVMRNAAGDFVASATPFASTIARAAMVEGDSAQLSSVYAAIYNAALMQNIPSQVILQKLRVHAYDTDFRRRVGPGDFAEYFFDVRDEHGGETSFGELLFTALATGGEVYRYWRFRTPDGVIDYYDDQGNNSKKFLMRRPVRGENVRLASGFGMRFHPILRSVRPHYGIDWAAPTGTPILAAGNGVVEEAKYKGEYGNYIRIRHANGYQSSYAHMSRYAARIGEGARVRQGEVIGFIGNTGLSAGPHLHFEILVNSRPVDPLSIQVPRERRLTGKLLADYQKERARIDELMRRQPVAMDNK